MVTVAIKVVNVEKKMERLKDAEIIDSVDFSRDFEDTDQWRSVRPLPYLLLLVPVIGLVVFLLFRFRFLIVRLAGLGLRLNNLKNILKQIGSIALRIAEKAIEEEK
jgi:hypothetical protein